jgi:hypothetical protein
MSANRTHPAEIAITGKLRSRGTLDTLLLELVYERLAVATRRAFAATRDVLQAEVFAAIREARPARFRREDAADEGFRDLEYFCQQVGLSYRRTTFGGAPCPSVVYWHPGLDEPGEVLADCEGQPMVSASLLLELLQLPAEDLKDRLDALLTPCQLAAGVGLVPALTALEDFSNTLKG